MGLRFSRLALLISALISIVISVVMAMALSYADEHKYEPGFEWVSSGSMQPLALLMFGAFVGGLVMLVVGLRRKPE